MSDVHLTAATLLPIISATLVPTLAAATQTLSITFAIAIAIAIAIATATAITIAITIAIAIAIATAITITIIAISIATNATIITIAHATAMARPIATNSITTLNAAASSQATASTWKGCTWPVRVMVLGEYQIFLAGQVHVPAALRWLPRLLHGIRDDARPPGWG